MQVKAKHAIVQWSEPIDGRVNIEYGFRGQLLEIPDAEAERLLRLDAVVSVEEELPRNGSMTPLDPTADDDRILAWVYEATDSEIRTQIAATPEIKARVLAAYASKAATEKARQEHLGTRRELIEGIATPDLTPAYTDASPETTARINAADLLIPGDDIEVINGQPPVNPELLHSVNTTGEPGTETTAVGEPATPEAVAAAAAGLDTEDDITDTTTPDDGDGVNWDEVLQTVESASAWLEVNPTWASQLLDKETERRSGDPRKGVIAAVEEAAKRTAE
jgi:hypothetical protein